MIGWMPRCLHLRALNSRTLLNAEMRLTRSGAALAESARRLARSKAALEKSRMAKGPQRQKRSDEQNS
jgi:hypothetical protein